MKSRWTGNHTGRAAFLFQAAVGLGFLSRGVRLDALVQTAIMSDIAQKVGDLPDRPYGIWNLNMVYNPDIHHRRSIRLKDYDYSQAGAYFVTFCTWQRECLFGEIVNGEMMLNDVGQIVLEEWQRTPKIRKEIELDVVVAMPNHFHGILWITNNGESVGATGRTPLPPGPQPRSLGAFAAGFKSATTKRINQIRNNPGCPVWQRNYYERIIRNDDELSRAREYIVNNPIKWELDKENPINYG